MNRVTITVNGAAVTMEVEPRTHLADFLREDLGLTGTHLGCEHGVCGACTLLIDDAPARSCIAYAAACDGATIRTIEGLEDDPTMVQLRAAFTAEHALQCGYCTPGMLVTARDIVHRLPNADEAAIRLELSGNLCRCTGYAGIVRAIQRVLAESVTITAARPRPLPPLPAAAFSATTHVVPVTTPNAAAAASPHARRIVQTVTVASPIHAVWDALRDPALVASCVPGARLTNVSPDRLSGEIRAALGPIETLFAGEATVAFHDLERRADLTGEGSDVKTGTRLSAHANVTLRERDATATDLTLSIDYTLRGPLAQFARAGMVRELATEIAGIAARDLSARIRGTSVAPPPRLTLGRLLWRVGVRWLRTVFGRRGTN
jgi:carbon-monoxide dehydrogenase small subunit